MISGLNRRAFGLAVYASQGRSPATTQDSLPAAGPALPDGIPTRRVPTKGFTFEAILLSRASWRNVSSFLGSEVNWEIHGHHTYLRGTSNNRAQCPPICCPPICRASDTRRAAFNLIIIIVSVPPLVLSFAIRKVAFAPP
jgi:hypothetical protein